MRAIKPLLGRSLRTTEGVIISAIAAVVASAVSTRTPLKLFLPLVFALLLIVLAARFGAIVSVFGSLTAAAIFARMIYAPIGAFSVRDATARGDLAWMVLISVVGSYLLFPPGKKIDNQEKK